MRYSGKSRVCFGRGVYYYFSVLLCILKITNALLAESTGISAFVGQSRRWGDARWARMATEKNDFQETSAAMTEKGAIITCPPQLPLDAKSFGTYPSALHQVHIETLLEPDQAAHALQLANAHAESTGCWARPDSDRHVTYATVDFPIDSCDSLTEYLDSLQFDERIFQRLSTLYGIRIDDLSYLDLFCANYKAKETDANTDPENSMTMDQLELHRDGSLLSFTILLTPPGEFEGGGTEFDALRGKEVAVDDAKDCVELTNDGVVRPRQAGHAVFHSGKLLHGGHVLTKGERTVLVGFVEVGAWNYQPGILAAACRDWGRIDVMNFLHHRQSKLEPNQPFAHAKYLPSANSCLKHGPIPFLDGIARRGNNPEYQRRKKLEAEDWLLRNIIIPPEQRDLDLQKLGLSGDVTIL
jgi:hypothetical protein